MKIRCLLIALCIAPFLATAGIVSACGVGERESRVELSGRAAGAFMEFAPPIAARHMRP